MAASTAVSSALLSGDSIVVPGDYSASPSSGGAGLPMELDPGLQAGFVVLSPFPAFRFSTLLALAMRCLSVFVLADKTSTSLPRRATFFHLIFSTL